MEAFAPSFCLHRLVWCYPEALAARKRAGVKLGRPKGVGKSKLDQFRPEIEALIANGSSQKFVAERYGTSEVNVSRWMKKHGLKKRGRELCYDGNAKV